MANGSVILRFKRERETKNAVRFQEVPPDGQAEVVGTLYVKRWWLIGDAQEITVEIRQG